MAENKARKKRIRVGIWFEDELNELLNKAVKINKLGLTKSQIIRSGTKEFSAKLIEEALEKN